MGLLSKLKTSTGLIKNRLSSSVGKLKNKGADVVNKAKNVRFLGSAVKLASKVGKVGLKVGKVTKLTSPIGLGITAATVGYGVTKRIKKKKEAQTQSQMKASTGITGGDIQRPEKKSLGKKILTGLGVAAVGAGALYAGEQIAEKLGVRGGAGFIGRKPKKKITRKRKARTGKSRKGRRVSFTTRDGRKVSFTPRFRRSSLSYRRKRGRKGRGVSKTELRQLKTMLRRYERD